MVSFETLIYTIVTIAVTAILVHYWPRFWAWFKVKLMVFFLRRFVSAMGTNQSPLAGMLDLMQNKEMQQVMTELGKKSAGESSGAEVSTKSATVQPNQTGNVEPFGSKSLTNIDLAGLLKQGMAVLPRFSEAMNLGDENKRKEKLGQLFKEMMEPFGTPPYIVKMQKDGFNSMIDNMEKSVENPPKGKIDLTEFISVIPQLAELSKIGDSNQRKQKVRQLVANTMARSPNSPGTKLFENYITEVIELAAQRNKGADQVEKLEQMVQNKDLQQHVVNAIDEVSCGSGFDVASFLRVGIASVPRLVEAAGQTDAAERNKRFRQICKETLEPLYKVDPGYAKLEEAHINRLLNVVSDCNKPVTNVASESKTEIGDTLKRCAAILPEASETIDRVIKIEDHDEREKQMKQMLVKAVKSISPEMDSKTENFFNGIVDAHNKMFMAMVKEEERTQKTAEAEQAGDNSCVASESKADDKSNESSEEEEDSDEDDPMKRPPKATVANNKNNGVVTSSTAPENPLSSFLSQLSQNLNGAANNNGAPPINFQGILTQFMLALTPEKKAADIPDLAESPITD